MREYKIAAIPVDEVLDFPDEVKSFIGDDLREAVFKYTASLEEAIERRIVEKYIENARYVEKKMDFRYVRFKAEDAKRFASVFIEKFEKGELASVSINCGKSAIPISPGVYAFADGSKVLYVGAAGNLQGRICCSGHHTISAAKRAGASRIVFMPTPKDALRQTEQYVIRHFLGKFNKFILEDLSIRDAVAFKGELDSDVADALTAYAFRRGVTADEAMNHLLSNALKAKGLLDGDNCLTDKAVETLSEASECKVA